ncbi:uncharacterized protein EV420DRAFT_1638632 [Desarmillaria tabescens]|uniref:Uncharacterized protein n=1 Tax=Armillaria tabescens TaxID=1929756 RepID=A0AA39TM00_ARMTA|nr:uncharacterized protein EV420DRAFT_1638632 [Desarmillaria tabescens]KAK0463707.1 hypothetical protein EV420DRAFT_1638632 [Desarmillaria tabescens]
MAGPLFDTRFQRTPLYHYYFTFSIDVAATLEFYCDGGDEVMLQKLAGLQEHKYAGYCIDDPSQETPKYKVINIRLVQQGLTKPHPRKPDHARPQMCIPIFPETAHPRSREPLRVSKPLPWDHCYHPTCYDLWARVPSESRDYLYTPYVILSLPLYRALQEDNLYGELLRAGLDDDRIQRIIDGQEEAPDTDDVSETDSQACQKFLVKIPGSDDLGEDGIFVPVMRIDHVLSNVPEISDPSQLWGDVDFFREIVQEYQLARYGSILFDPPQVTEVDDTSVYSITSGVSCSSSTEELSPDSPDSHKLDLTSKEFPLVPVRSRKGRIKSLFWWAIMNLAELVKWRKFSSK